MGAAIRTRQQQVRFPEGGDEVVETTLLELVQAVTDVAQNEHEVVATVVHMLRSGKVRLTGNFRGTIPDAA